MEKKVKIISGDFSKRNLRIGIVASKFNDFIVDRLLSGAIDSLILHGVDQVSKTKLKKKTIYSV